MHAASMQMRKNNNLKFTHVHILNIMHKEGDREKEGEKFQCAIDVY